MFFVNVFANFSCCMSSVVLFVVIEEVICSVWGLWMCIRTLMLLYSS